METWKDGVVAGEMAGGVGELQEEWGCDGRGGCVTEKIEVRKVEWVCGEGWGQDRTNVGVVGGMKAGQIQEVC